MQETLASHGAGGKVQSEIPRHGTPLPDLSFAILLVIPGFLQINSARNVSPVRSEGFWCGEKEGWVFLWFGCGFSHAGLKLPFASKIKWRRSGGSFKQRPLQAQFL